jgi:hypothetical protein
MAFTGLHVVTGYKGGIGFRGTPTVDSFKPTASQSVATGTLSTLVAPAFHKEYGSPYFRVYASADSWVSTGAAPDETTDPRVLVKALTPTDIQVTAGDKIKWVAA